jgi:glucan biosynthesis protein C
LAYTAKLVGKLQKYSPGMSSLIVAVLTALSFLIGRTMHFALTQNLLHDGPYNYVVQALYTYAPYFLLGVMACKYETIFRILHHVSWAQAGVAILLLAFVRYNENATTAALGFPISEAIRHFSSALAGFYICCILINLFSMYFVDESRIGRFFSQASYTVYLFHMLALVVVQKVLLAIGITGIGLYLFSMILAFALCILIHVVIVRQSPSTELIFNGKLMGRQKAPTTPADVAVSGASG